MILKRRRFLFRLVLGKLTAVSDGHLGLRSTLAGAEGLDRLKYLHTYKRGEERKTEENEKKKKYIYEGRWGQKRTKEEGRRGREHTLNDLAEDSVTTVEPRTRDRGDEELRAVR